MKPEPGPASTGKAANRAKPIRGIDWSAIFERRPELNPPGYQEVMESMRASRAAKMRSDA